MRKRYDLRAGEKFLGFGLICDEPGKVIIFSRVSAKIKM